MFVEAIAAGVVGAALLWLVLQPLLMPSAPVVEEYDAPDVEETPRGIALLALHEIDFDRATGKLSDADYAELHARYSARAIAVLNDEAGERCAVHGASGVAGARFCPNCGGKLK